MYPRLSVSSTVCLLGGLSPRLSVSFPFVHSSVFLLVCLSSGLSVSLTVYILALLSTLLSPRLPVSLSVFLFPCLLFYLPVCFLFRRYSFLHVDLSLCLSLFMSAYILVCLFLGLPIFLSAALLCLFPNFSVFPSIHLLFILSSSPFLYQPIPVSLSLSTCLLAPSTHINDNYTQLVSLYYKDIYNIYLDNTRITKFKFPQRQLLLAITSP